MLRRVRTFKVVVVKRESDAVQPEAAKEGRIGIHEEVFQELYDVGKRVVLE